MFSLRGWPNCCPSANPACWVSGADDGDVGNRELAGLIACLSLYGGCDASTV
jgi:hypothetical protein